MAQNPKQIWATCALDTVSGLVLNDMASDTSGNTYYTGYMMDSSYYANHHFLLIKIDKNGVFEWIKNYPFAVSDTFETGNALVVDQKGFVYVAGEITDSFCNICTQTVKVRDQFVIKYSPTGNVIWINRLNASKYIFQSPSEIIVSRNGNVFVAGSESVYNPKTYQSSSRGYLQRITPFGKTNFLKRIKEVQPNSIAIDNNNDIVFGGRILSQNLYQLAKIFIAKYSFFGDSLWARTFSESNKNGGAQYLKTDGSNNIYLLGQTDTITFYNNPRAILLKYDRLGTLLWHYKEPDRTYCRYSTSGMQLDSKGNIYTAIYMDNKGTTNEDWYISKFNSYGLKKWSYLYDDSLNGNNYPTGIALDDQSNIFISGVLGKTYNPYMYGTMQLDSSGNRKWLKQYTSIPRGNNFSIGIAFTGKSVVTGGYTSKGVCAVKYELATIVAPKLFVEEMSQSLSNQIMLYPNPATDIIQIKMPTSFQNQTVSIINIYGGIVRQITSFKSNTLLSISTNDLPTGLYFVKVSGSDKTNYISSFVKK